MSTIGTRIAFGGWGLGGKNIGILGYGPIDIPNAIDLVEESISKGIIFFDTAPAYGDGLSEKILGLSTKDHREKVFLASKIGITDFRNGQNFDLSEIKQSFDDSLKRLNTDYLDLVQLHDPESVDKIPGVVDFLLESRSKGLIKNIGVSIKNPLDFDQWAKIKEINYFQVNFSALDQRLLSTSVASEVEIREVNIIARTSLCFGFLTDLPPKREELDDTDHRKRWSENQFQNWINASNKVFEGISVQSKTEAAIRFCLSFPWIKVVLTGIMNKNDLESNVKIEKKGPLDSKDVKKIIDNYASASLHIPRLISI
jgi:aryl-alcohol dehydrogenase-like predicted oxidoreductase